MKPNLSVLIVDDSATTRAMVRRVLRMTSELFGNVGEAADGCAGLAVMAARDIDLVMTDINMPVISGVEMIHRMRADDRLRAIPVIVISAQPDAALVDELARCQTIGYLSKPFTAERVRDLVASAFAPLVGG